MKLTVNSYASHLNCTLTELYYGPDLKLLNFVEAAASLSLAWPGGVHLVIRDSHKIYSGDVRHPMDVKVSQHVASVFF